MASTSVLRVYSQGQFVEMLDGTVWEIDTLDRITTVLWLPITDVLVLQESLYSYVLVGEDGVPVHATRQ